MNTKFVDLTELYKLGIHKKLSLKSIWVIKGFATPRLRNSIGGRTLVKVATLGGEGNGTSANF